MHATPEQSVAWLRSRMEELDLTSLDQVAELCGSDKGNISRIFHQKQRPRVDALEPMAAGLEISVYELLVRIGAVDPDSIEPPVLRRKNGKAVFTWPSKRR
jgi:transcriptional regulator with XRE-family HTH domain